MRADAVAAAVCASTASAWCFWLLARRGAARRGTMLRAAPAWPVLVAAAATGGASVAGSPYAAVLVAAAPAAAICASTDWEVGLIFDDVTAAALCAILVVEAVRGEILAALAGSALVVALLGSLRAVTRGTGLGLGDVKFGAVAGASLGVLDGVASIGLAFVLAGCYGAVLLAMRRAGRGSIVRFGPFLAAGLLSVGIHPCFR
jgi:leader peptidase (prepilin peptidase) / N-methyltransferase